MDVLICSIEIFSYHRYCALCTSYLAGCKYANQTVMRILIVFVMRI